MQKSIERLAHGGIAARKHLERQLREIAGLSHDQAIHAANFYLRKRLARLDHLHGTSHVKHGAFLDHGPAAEAARLGSTLPKKREKRYGS